MTTAERLQWWLGIFETTRDEELDCDVVFEALDTAAEAAARGEDVGVQVRGECGYWTAAAAGVEQRLARGSP